MFNIKYSSALIMLLMLPMTAYSDAENTVMGHLSPTVAQSPPQNANATPKPLVTNEDWKKQEIIERNKIEEMNKKNKELADKLLSVHRKDVQDLIDSKKGNSGKSTSEEIEEILNPPKAEPWRNMSFSEKITK
ncbi:MAG: hypothetical protein QM500_13545, partial [Methylococcales bacterium]